MHRIDRVEQARTWLSPGILSIPNRVWQFDRPWPVSRCRWNRTHRVRVWGAREVERKDQAWQFHVHLLVDLGGADPEQLGKLLRGTWAGSRQVQIKRLESRQHRANVMRLAHYMTKARYTHVVGDHREWLSDEEIVTLALWRDRQSLQWHQLTWGVRRV